MLLLLAGGLVLVGQRDGLSTADRRAVVGGPRTTTSAEAPPADLADFPAPTGEDPPEATAATAAVVTGGSGAACPKPDQVTAIVTTVTSSLHPDGSADKVSVAGQVSNDSAAPVTLNGATIDVYDAAGSKVDDVIIPLSGQVAAGATKDWSATTAATSDDVATKGAVSTVSFGWLDGANVACPTS